MCFEMRFSFSPRHLGLLTHGSVCMNCATTVQGACTGTDRISQRCCDMRCNGHSYYTTKTAKEAQMIQGQCAKCGRVFALDFNRIECPACFAVRIEAVRQTFKPVDALRTALGIPGSFTVNRDGEIVGLEEYYRVHDKVGGKVTEDDPADHQDLLGMWGANWTYRTRRIVGKAMAMYNVWNVPRPRPKRCGQHAHCCGRMCRRGLHMSADIIRNRRLQSASIKPPTDTKGTKLDFALIRANLQQWVEEDAKRKAKEAKRLSMENEDLILAFS